MSLSHTARTWRKNRLGGRGRALVWVGQTVERVTWEVQPAVGKGALQGE